jgi:hypothetical protein
LTRTVGGVAAIQRDISERLGARLLEIADGLHREIIG